MGQEIKTSRFDEADFADFRIALQRETELLGSWFEGDGFSNRPLMVVYELVACVVSSCIICPAHQTSGFLQMLHDHC